MSTPMTSAESLLVDLDAGDIPHPGGTLGEAGPHPAQVREDRLAGLCHAFYGTDGFPQASTSPTTIPRSVSATAPTCSP